MDGDSSDDSRFPAGLTVRELDNIAIGPKRSADEPAAGDLGQRASTQEPQRERTSNMKKADGLAAKQWQQVRKVKK